MKVKKVDDFYLLTDQCGRPAHDCRPGAIIDELAYRFGELGEFDMLRLQMMLLMQMIFVAGLRVVQQSTRGVGVSRCRAIRMRTVRLLAVSSGSVAFRVMAHCYRRIVCE